MTDIILTAEHNLTRISNAGPRRRSNLVAEFLCSLSQRGAFLRISAGPYATSHALPNERVAGFVAYARSRGFAI